MLQLLSSFVISMRPYEGEIQGLLYYEGYMRMGCLQEAPVFCIPLTSANRKVRLT